MSPTISVVMSVYNEVDTLEAALTSVLCQEGVELEVIVVDDGSSDGSAQLLEDAAARDPRLRVLHKGNEGLTRALIQGCAMAKAPWIARQDADDVSLPGRLRAQRDRAEQADAPVLVSCGAMWRSPEGVDMFPILPPREPGALRRRILQEGRSICAHGTAFFSREAYEAVGGYRAAFYYAQDLDLFTRLARHGAVEAVPEILYAHTFSPLSISSHSAPMQAQFRELISRSDAHALREASELSQRIRKGGVRKLGPFSGSYFIGCCLRGRNPQVAARYFRRALARHPWSLRSLVRLLQCSGGRR